MSGEDDLDDAYRFLIPAINGRRLTADEDRHCRKALARLLRHDDTFLDRGLRHMLAAVFDSDRVEFVDAADDVAVGYAWLASERIATLNFRSKTRRKSPIRDLWIAMAIAGDRTDRNISVEEATHNIAERFGIDYETAKKAWQVGLKQIQMEGKSKR
jgi:hypothetical protein